MLSSRHASTAKTLTSDIHLIGPELAKLGTRAITMFKIEKVVEGDATVLRLVGRINAEHLDELNQLIGGANHKLSKLDLSEVTLVDLNVIRFLGDQEQRGVELVKCSAYIREWIQREIAANSFQQENDTESKERE